MAHNIITARGSFFMPLNGAMTISQVKLALIENNHVPAAYGYADVSIFFRGRYLGNDETISSLNMLPGDQLAVNSVLREPASASTSSRSSSTPDDPEGGGGKAKKASHGGDESGDVGGAGQVVN